MNRNRLIFFRRIALHQIMTHNKAIKDAHKYTLRQAHQSKQESPFSSVAVDFISFSRRGNDFETIESRHMFSMMIQIGGTFSFFSLPIYDTYFIPK